MAKYCEVCHKGVVSGNNVSHSNRKTKRKWAPNVQRVKVVEDGNQEICVHALFAFGARSAFELNPSL